MEFAGGCYCGNVRYKAAGDPMFKGQCHCRECQYISGGHPNVVMAMPDGGFTYTKGKAKQYTRADLPNPVTREFCADCGTLLLSKPPTPRGAVLLKGGTFDDRSLFGGPQMAI